MGDKIFYKGELGDLGYEAAISRYSEQKIEAVGSFKRVIHAVETGEASSGIIPFDSSSGGRFIEPIEALSNSKSSIISEILIESRFVLASKSIKSENVDRIYITPDSAYSCQSYTSHRKGLQINLAETLSSIIEEIKSNENLGVICSESFARIHNLVILKRGIQEQIGNTIRFVIVSLAESVQTGRDKTTLLFNTKHQPGALFKTLCPIAESGLQMTRLESIPIKYRPWQYSFIADIIGHAKETKVNNALREMREYCSSLKILGSYPYIN